MIAFDDTAATRAECLTMLVQFKDMLTFTSRRSPTLLPTAAVARRAGERVLYQRCASATIGDNSVRSPSRAALSPRQSRTMGRAANPAGRAKAERDASAAFANDAWPSPWPITSIVASDVATRDVLCAMIVYSAPGTSAAQK